MANSPSAQAEPRSRTSPHRGIITAGIPSILVIVEFGSFACRYCREFQDSIYPELKEHYLEAGKARFRFVSIDSAAPLVRLSAWAACAAGEHGLEAAVREGFAFFSANRNGLLHPDQGFLGLPAGGLSSCVQSEAGPRLEEARAARLLGVQAVPTFVVGLSDSSGHMVGWVVEGMYRARLDSTIRAAVELLQAGE
ncbi:MAG: DsbA family protein [Gemmatimonadales bacterium]